MNNHLELNRIIRNQYLNLINHHSLEELNKVPDGYNNNIIWNIAHSIVTQQLLVYKLSNLPMIVHDDMVAMYKKGTKTEKPVTTQEVSDIKTLLFSTMETTEKDLNTDIFNTYNDFTTSPGYTISSIEEALAFNNFHEGIHLGYILALKKHI